MPTKVFTPGEILTAANTNAYLANKSISNAVINGAFDIWQRGTSVGINADLAVYTADRFQVYGNVVPTTTSRQPTNDTTNLPNIRFAARVQRNSGSSSTFDVRLLTALETSDSRPFSGKTVTLSFWARAGANWSASNLATLVRSGTGTDQSFLNFTGIVDSFKNEALNTTWRRFSRSVPIPANSTQIGLLFGYTPSGTAGANDWFEITGIQLEEGTVANDFRRNANSIQGELAACQRYYQRINYTAETAFSSMAYGHAFSTTQALVFFNLKELRRFPISVDFSTVCLDDIAGGAPTVTALAIDAGRSNASIATLSVTVGSGLTQFRPYILRGNNTVNSFVGISAEL
jgi:hypothetical protein